MDSCGIFLMATGRRKICVVREDDRTERLKILTKSRKDRSRQTERTVADD